MEKLPGSPEVPVPLKREYSGWSWDVAYQYGPDTLVYRLSGDPGEIRYLKLARVGQYPTLEEEADRVRWALDYLPVPEVIEQDSGDQLRWMVTRALPGRDATDSTLMANPEQLVPILAAGLKTFHEAPVEACPFDFRLGKALAHARRRLEEGRGDVAVAFYRLLYDVSS